MKKILASCLLALLVGCSTYSDGTPIYWGNLEKAVNDHNARAPKTTYCDKNGTQVICRQY